MSTGGPPRLPDFTAKRCELLTVCGNFEPGSLPPSPGFSAAPSWEYAQYRRGRRQVRTAFLRDLPRGGGSGPHFHIDFTVSGWPAITSEEPDKPLAAPELLAALAPFEGRQFDADVIGYFTATTAELPAVIREATVPADASRVGLELTGAQYAVRGAPIHTVIWRRFPGNDESGVILQARTGGDIRVAYFQDCLDLVEGAFTALFGKG